MLGKFAGLSVLAALAMIFVTPLMANPAMCGLPNDNATFREVISGFTLNPTTNTYTFTPAPANTPIMIGTWVAVLDQKTGKEVPVALEQPFRLSANTNYKSNAPALPAPSLTQNSELIVGIPHTQVASVCTKNEMCNLPAKPNTATLVQVINGFKLNSDGTYTFQAASGFPLALGSFVEVTLPNGRNVPASIVKVRGVSKAVAPVNPKDLSQGYIAYGYVYIPAGGNTDQAQSIKITIPQTTMNSIKATSPSSISGW